MIICIPDQKLIPSRQDDYVIQIPISRIALEDRDVPARVRNQYIISTKDLDDQDYKIVRVPKRRAYYVEGTQIAADDMSGPKALVQGLGRKGAYLLKKLRKAILGEKTRKKNQRNVYVMHRQGDLEGADSMAGKADVYTEDQSGRLKSKEDRANDAAMADEVSPILDYIEKEELS